MWSADGTRRATAEAGVGASSSEAVLLLHGSWMNRWVMSYLAFALRREGLAAQTLTYHTMRDTLEDHLGRLTKRIAEIAAPRVHLVGHSLGGVIVLRYLQRRPDERIRRAVLIGTPVSGCQAAADLAHSPCGEFLLGKSLGIWREPVNASLDPRFEIGAIAGTRASFARSGSEVPASRTRSSIGPASHISSRCPPTACA